MDTKKKSYSNENMANNNLDKEFSEIYIEDLFQQSENRLHTRDW